MPTFAETRLAELALVPWLDGPVGRAYAGAVGRAQDGELAKLKDAVRMRNPLDAPTDAHPYLGRDRMIEQAPGESPEAYALRLDNAHNIWLWAGTRDGLLSVFEPFLLPLGEQYFTPATETAPPSSPLVRVFDYGRLGGPFWTNGDPAHPWWSKCGFILDARRGPWTTDGTHAEPGTFGDEGLVGSTITSAELGYMRRMIRRLKAPDCYPLYVAVILEGDCLVGFLPNGFETFGDDTGTFGADHYEAFLRVGHAFNEEVLWGGSDGTFGDPGTHQTFED